MKCFLMNKNTEVALIELDENTNNINQIYEIYQIDYAPLSLKNAINNKALNPVKVLNDWFRGRGIPSWRRDIENLLQKLNVTSSDELLNKAYALSLSDQYWIKTEEQKELNWKDINFFTNDFRYKGYLQVSFSSNFSEEEVDLHSPNNTTDGMLQKAWIIENGKRILVKGTYFSSRQEPLNEWLASQICKRLGINYCNYEIAISENKLVSKCENFVTQDEEIVTAYEIFHSVKKDNNTNDFNHYVQILEQNGIPDARQQVEDMFLVDFLVMNIDRHMKNFGIIRNVETLKWERVTPIFDTGECMQCDKLLNEINFADGTGKYFLNTNKNFSSYLGNIDLSRYDFSKLEGLAEEWKENLLKYQDYMDISKERIEKLYYGLSYRISKLRK